MHDPQDRWGSWPEDGDPVGVASARLLALDVDRPDRLAALRLLGLLLDHADAGGAVRASTHVLATEFGLAAVDVARHLELLRQTDVVTGDDGALHIAGFEHHRATGLRDGEALALLASILESDRPAPSEPAVPAGVEVPELAQPAESVAAVEPVAVIDLTDAAAALTAGIAEAAAPAGLPSVPDRAPVLLPALTAADPVDSAATGPKARTRRPGGSRPGAVRRAPVTSFLALLTGLVLVVAGVFARPGPRPVEVTDVAAGAPVTTIEVPSALPGTVLPSIEPRSPTSAPASTTPDAGGGRLAADSPSGGAAGAVDTGAPTGPAAGSGEIAAGSATACPDVVPAVADVVARVEPADLDALLGTSPWVVIVEGRVLGGAEQATVTSLPVRVQLADGSQITGDALTSAVGVGPGRAVPWELRAQTVSIAAPEITTVVAGPPLSAWTDEALAAACPIA